MLRSAVNKERRMQTTTDMSRACGHRDCNIVFSSKECGGDMGAWRELKRHEASSGAHSACLNKPCDMCLRVFKMPLADFEAWKKKTGTSSSGFRDGYVEKARLEKGSGSGISAATSSTSSSTRRSSTRLRANSIASQMSSSCDGANSRSSSAAAGSSSVSKNLIFDFENEERIENNNTKNNNDDAADAIQMTKSELADINLMRDAIVSWMGEWKDSNVLRQLLVGAACLCGAKQTTIAKFFQVSPSTVTRGKLRYINMAEKVREEQHVARSRLSGVYYTPPDVLERVEKIWQRISEQTLRHDKATGERLTYSWLNIPTDHAYLEYRRIELLRILNLNVGDKREEDKTVNFQFEWKRLLKERKVVSRCTFLNLRPSDIFDRQIHGHKCSKCRLGCDKERAMNDKLEELHNGVDCDCGTDDSKLLNQCNLVMDFKETEEYNKHQIIMEALDCHIADVKRQREACANDIENLKELEIGIKMDFSPNPKAFRRDTTMSDDMGGVQCLHLVLYIGSNDNQITYYDYYAHEANDYFFVRRTFLHFFSMPLMKENKLKWIWSDGGPKHFKLKRTLGFILVECAQKQLNYPITWNFFISNHGKDIYDAHAGQNKQRFRQAAREGEVIEGAKEMAIFLNNFRPLNADARAALDRTKKKLSRPVNAFSFARFDRTTQSYEWEKFDGVRIYHQWRWTGETVKQKVNVDGEGQRLGKKKGRHKIKQVEIVLYKIEARLFSTDEEFDTMYIKPSYEIDVSDDGSRLDEAAPVKVKRRRKDPNILKRPELKKRAPLDIADEEEYDYNREDEEYEDLGRFVMVAEEDTIIERDFKKYNVRGKRVAVKYELEGELNAAHGDHAWFSGSVVEAKREYKCKKIGREEFQSCLRIVFDGFGEKSDGELIIFDEDVRLLNLEKCVKIRVHKRNKYK